MRYASVFSFVVLVGFLFSFLTPAAWASRWSPGQPILPPECTGDAPCLTICSLVHTTQHLIDFVVYFAVLIATAVILWGAFLLIAAAGNTGAIEKGKKAITLAITGLVVTFGSWIIVNTIILVFGRGEQPPGFPWPWHAIRCG